MQPSSDVNWHVGRRQIATIAGRGEITGDGRSGRQTRRADAIEGLTASASRAMGQEGRLCVFMPLEDDARSNSVADEKHRVGGVGEFAEGTCVAFASTVSPSSNTAAVHRLQNYCTHGAFGFDHLDLKEDGSLMCVGHGAA